MAWTFKSVGTTNHVNSGADNTPTIPTHASGDVMIAAVQQRGPVSDSTDITTATSGWTKIFGNLSMAFFGKIATSASETNPTFSFTDTTAGYVSSATILLYTGGSLTVHDSNALNNASATDVPYPQLVITKDNCLVLEMAVIFDNRNVTPHPVGWNERVDADTATGLDACQSVIDQIQTTATSTAAHSGTISAAINSDSIAVALEEATAASSRPTTVGIGNINSWIK